MHASPLTEATSRYIRMRVRVPLHLEILQALEIIGASQEYIFWSGDGIAKSCVGDWQRTLRWLSVLSGVNITAHRFRHTFGCELLSKGVPVLDSPRSRETVRASSRSTIASGSMRGRKRWRFSRRFNRLILTQAAGECRPMSIQVSPRLGKRVLSHSLLAH
jgi:integrase